MRSSSKWFGAILISCVSFLVTVGVAQAVMVNRSFENGPEPGDAMALPPGSKAIEGWTIVDGSVSYVGSRWQHAQGVRSIGLPCGGGISQTLQTEPGQDYELRFTMAGDPNAVPAVKTVVASFGGEERAFTFDTSGHSLANMGWSSRSYIFKAVRMSTALTFLSPKTECSVPAVDSVRVEAVQICVQALPDARVGLFAACSLPRGLRSGSSEFGVARASN
jgi:choice-of-anchor C domain-containing protein